MNNRLPPLILACCLLCAGCQLAGNLARNTVYEVGRCTNECIEKYHCCQLAKQAWDKFVSTSGGSAFSKDYAEGFKCGYADYLFAGGTGDPPPFPPLCYWGACYETPEGYAAICDWFEGYRHGATAANESGYRQFMILPMSLPAPPPPPPDPLPAESPPPPGAGEKTEPASEPLRPAAPQPAQAPVPVLPPPPALVPVLPARSAAMPPAPQPGVAHGIIADSGTLGAWEPSGRGGEAAKWQPARCISCQDDQAAKWQPARCIASGSPTALVDDQHRADPGRVP